MIFTETPISGLFEIELEEKGDERGWFMRFFDSELFKKNIQDFDSDWKQMNHSYNALKYTWRGFHYQEMPYQETKIVRCVRGAVLDCVLDLRESSNTYLKSFQLELSSANKKMLYIPKGLAHGYLTLENDVELLYLHDEFYNPEFERGVRFDDIKITFELPLNPVVISERDKNHANL
jgi:dTDP-4-dehydrorhamnose 3,5-epimerase